MAKVYVIKINKARIVESIDTFEDTQEGNNKAEERFLELCSDTFSNWDEYTDSDKQELLDNGYEGSSEFVIQIFHY